MDIMRKLLSSSLQGSLILLAFAAALSHPCAEAQQRHNVIIFVADGLRRGSVNADVMHSGRGLSQQSFRLSDLYDGECLCDCDRTWIGGYGRL